MPPFILQRADMESAPTLLDQALTKLLFLSTAGITGDHSHKYTLAS